MSFYLKKVVYNGLKIRECKNVLDKIPNVLQQEQEQKLIHDLSFSIPDTQNNKKYKVTNNDWKDTFFQNIKIDLN